MPPSTQNINTSQPTIEEEKTLENTDPLEEEQDTSLEAQSEAKSSSDGINATEQKYEILCAAPTWKGEQSAQNLRRLHARQLGANDSVLLLWTPPETLKDAITVMKTWGYTYRTMLPFLDEKSRIKTIDTVCLVGTRGTVKQIDDLIKDREKLEVDEPLWKKCIKRVGKGSAYDILSK